MHTGPSRTLTRYALATLTVVMAAFVALIGTASPSQAASLQPHHRGPVVVDIAPVAAADVSTRAVTPLAGGWGYVTQGNLRRDPNLSAPIIVTIYNQWVNILCWIDGGSNGFGSNRWFKAQYYGQQGYLSSGVVSSQPVVGHC